MKLRSILLVALLLFAFTLPAQTPKLGHVDTHKVIEAMPAYKDAEKKLQDYVKQLQDQSDKMQQELQRLTDTYVSDEPNLSDPIKGVRQQEIKDLQNRLQMLQASAEDKVNDQQATLLKPLEDQVLTAIKGVATDKGYSYIFDSSAGVVLYMPPADDVTDLVKAKLGIQ